MSLPKAFPILYSRNKSGSVQTWQIFVSGNEYWTESGQMGGTITATAPTSCEGKSIGRANETTPEAQALAEAESRFTKKKKNKNFEDIADIDKNSFVSPMLAKGFNDRKDKVVYPVGVQIKYNGVRCIITKDGAWSRKGEPWLTIPHILDSLKGFFEKNPDAVLDGELFNFDLRERLNELVSIVRKKNVKPEDLAKSKAMVLFYCYDGYNFDGMVATDNYRKRATTIKAALADNPYYRHVQTIVANTLEDVMRIYASIVSEGHEGVIVRVLDSAYENDRSANLLKLKPTDDGEYKVIAWKYGSGNWGKLPKTVTCVDDKGNEFDATFKGSMKEAAVFLADIDNWMNKVYTIYFNGFTGLGTPNYAQFWFANCKKGDR